MNHPFNINSTGSNPNPSNNAFQSTTGTGLNLIGTQNKPTGNFMFPGQTTSSGGFQTANTGMNLSTTTGQTMPGTTQFSTAQTQGGLSGFQSSNTFGQTSNTGLGFGSNPGTGLGGINKPTTGIGANITGGLGTGPGR